MVICILPLFICLLPLPRPAPADTSQVFVGVLGQRFAWGTAALRQGPPLRAFLPATTTGLDGVVYYYPAAPDGSPAPKPKALAVDKVRWMRVQSQYSELLKLAKNEPGRLAARRSAGAVELFVVQYVPPVVLNLMGPTPVLTSPATSRAPSATASWYLRAADGAAVLIEPSRFASQVAGLLAKDPELARRVAAQEPGYGLAELESLVQRYNQHVR
jgi:hypothetical protein